MSYDYSENILVQESAGNLLRNELDWDVQFGYNTEILGKNGTFGSSRLEKGLFLQCARFRHHGGGLRDGNAEAPRQARFQIRQGALHRQFRAVHGKCASRLAQKAF